MSVTDYLSDFRARHTLPEIIGWLDRIAKLHPLVLGEAILDVYDFCKTLGVSSKDPTIAVLRERTEMYAGGALAVANHLAGLCDNPNTMVNAASVRLITRLGEFDRHEDFIREHLCANVLADFTTQRGAPTLCKWRIIDAYSGNKLLEVYTMDDRPETDPAQLVARLDAAMPECDLIIACDFGHGFFSERTIRRLWASGKSLAINVQSNAGNRGFNPVSRWRRADYICLANHEVETEIRQRDGDDREKLLEVTRRVACPHWTITRGRYGSLHYDVSEGAFYEAPALATKIVDRVGAGDAVFAITSLLARVGAPWDILAFVGNVAGAVAVEVLGNAKSIDRETLEERIMEMMKG
jgi:bifunctional ADP-heptose synthase (sugar kinase/adenylyltransferase)